MGNPTFSADALWGDRYHSELVPDLQAGNKKSVSSSTVILIPPVGCKKAQVISDRDIAVRVDGKPAEDDGMTAVIPAGSVSVIDVIPKVPVYAVGVGGTALVHIFPCAGRRSIPLQTIQSHGVVQVVSSPAPSSRPYRVWL